MPITKATASSIAPAAKGDLVVGSATNDAAVLGVGSNDQVLTADSSTATGLKWAAAGGGGGSASADSTIEDETSGKSGNNDASIAPTFDNTILSTFAFDSFLPSFDFFNIDSAASLSNAA